SLPYVAAMGMNGWLDNPTLYGALTDMSMAMMGPDSIYKMDEKDKARMLEWNKEMAGMVTGMQMVIGGAPKGKGMGSLSYVIKCKDSAKYRAMLPKGIEMSNKMIGSEEATPGVPKMSMTYTKDAAKEGKLSVDAINVVMKDVSDDETGQVSAIFKMALGEDNIRVLIATPDAKTMVVTIGGSIDAMKETIKVASGTGPIPTAPGTALALRHLPKNSSIIMLLNAGNLMDVIRAGMETAGQQPEVVGMAPTIKCKTPIAFGMKAKGSTLHTGLFVSKPLIKDIFLAVMKTIARKQQNTKPAPPPDDF
ncbi:MAG: hypothetical protein GY794_14060, partial [bacterium]|nr:hypothetical protein [bacterium]